MKRKIILIITTITFIIVLVTLSANSSRVSAETQYTSDYYKYTVTDGKATIIKYTNTSGSGTITIPSTLGYYYPVTRIDSWAFYECKELTGIIIPNSVTSIGDNAFYNCTGLTSITIPDSVTSIGGSAFYTTAWYKNQPDGLVYAGKLAYKYKGTCPSSVTIKYGTVGIADDAFSGCTNLTNINIPSSVTSIGEDAFYRCTGLTSITIPDSVTSIGEGAFNYCTGLTSIIIPDSVTSIGNMTFRDCKGLTIIIPDSVTSINDNAFYGCVSLKLYIKQNSAAESYLKKHNFSYGYYCGNYLYNLNYTFATITGIKDKTVATVDIPENVDGYPVVAIDNNAFNGCTRLTSITIPDSVTSIGDSAFRSCTRLTSITIPDSVTSIGSQAFYCCTNLTSITIPDSVTSIGGSAFFGCTRLKSITIPSSVTSIGNYAFYLCTGLTSITIPDSVTSIGDYAFSGCKGLTSITIPDSVTSIGGGAFSDCFGLTEITIPFVGESRKTSSNTYQYPFGYIFGTSSYTGGTATTQYYYGSSTSSATNTTYYIPITLEKVTVTGGNILYGAFYNCSKLTSITIPSSVTSIGNSAFYGCTGLTSITIPSSVTSIGGSAFSGCTGLTSITIPDSVTSIGGSAFSGCTGLTNITIPESVKSIGDGTFQNCSSLESITIPDCVTSIGDGAFNGCTNLTITANYKSAGYNYAIANNIPLYKTVSDIIPAAPAALLVEPFSITLVPVANAEYSLDKTNWQSENVFSGLELEKEYTFYLRLAETSTSYPSETSSGTKMKTRKYSVSAPDAPVLDYALSREITLVRVDGVEYSKDGTNWQTSNVFTGLSPVTEYTFYARIAETDTTYAGPASVGVTYSTIKDTVAPPSAPASTVVESRKVVLSEVSGAEYSLGGSVWQTSNVFSGLLPNKEYTFYIRYAETDTAFVSAASDGTTIRTVKDTVSPPAAPIVESIEARSVTLCYVYGAEYSRNGITWQKSNVFNGLLPVTEYTFYVRLTETDTAYTTSASTGTKATTIKDTVAPPSAPVVSSIEARKITLKMVSGVEYSKDGFNWQKSNVFDGLIPVTEYTFYIRKTETSTTYTSAASAGVTVKTAKDTISPPAAPVIESIEARSVTVYPVNGAEYSKDGTNWQTSNVFTGLFPVTKYTFYVRYVETETTLTTAASAGTSVTTIKDTVAAPSAPVSTDIGARKITLRMLGGMEYSKDGYTWQKSNVFEELLPVTQYTFYARKAETATAYASAASEALTVTTTKDFVAAPDAPTVESITSRSVTLASVNGAEYSKDGIVWQASNLFIGLIPATEYTFYVRIAETSTSFASSASAGKRATTIKDSVEPPAAPTISKVEARKITVVSVSGTEYSLDKSVWQKNNVFSNLSPATEYTVYARIAETATAYASSAGEGTKVTTDKYTVTPPGAPVADKIGSRTITLVNVSGNEYSIDGTTWQKSNVFTGLLPVTEYELYARKSETPTTYASEKSTASKITTVKDSASAPDAPEVQWVDSGKIVVEAIEGIEYSLDGTNWQISNAFEDLLPNTRYYVYARKCETATEFASPASKGTSVTTLKLTVEAPASPEIDFVGSRKVSVVAVSGMEYSIDGTNWQSSNEFAGLSPVTEYTVYARKSETSTSYASAASTATVVKTKKDETSAPSAPVVETCEPNKITLVSIEGYEYSINGNEWQTENVFTGLEPNTDYSFRIRIAETATAFVSPASGETKATTLKYSVEAPNAPEVHTVESRKIVLVSVEGLEYSIDGSVWQKSNEFDGLLPVTEYTFFARISETDTAYASPASNCTKVITVKDSVTAPSAPIVLQVESRKITLVKIRGIEYSLDGTVWQSSNEFTDLLPVTDYTFYARVAETDTEFASPASSSVTATTIKDSVSAPNAPTIDYIGSDKVILTLVDEFEYSIDGVNWQKSNEFTNLSPVTEYTFYVRFAETDTAFASPASEGVKATTGSNIHYGDVNGDGEITAVDVVRLKKYFAEYDPISDASAVVIGSGADANGDGNITALDVIRLKKYLAGYDPKTGVSTVRLGPAA